MPTNQPSVPRSAPGPPSMPRISPVVHHHASAASTNSRATRAGRDRTASRASAGPPRRRSAARTETAGATSGGPGEARAREARLALVLDAERVDAGPGRLRDRQLGPRRVEDAGQPRGLTRLDPERDDVLDLEVDGVPDLHAVQQPLLADLDRGAFDSEVLADQPAERLHRPAELSAEHGAELRGLLVR